MGECEFVLERYSDNNSAPCARASVMITVYRNYCHQIKLGAQSFQPRPSDYDGLRRLAAPLAVPSLGSPPSDTPLA